MNPERWQNLQKIYNEVAELTPEESAPFLEKACVGDPEMRQEVESLLDCEGKLGTFMVGTAIEALAQTHKIETLDDVEADNVERFIGAVIADRYVVQSYVGSGGMGDVYRAEHRLLRKPVAIKRLSSKFRDRPAYRQQLMDEARRAVLLDHENVASVKDVVEQFDEVFVVMEFIDGPTLRSSLRDPFTLDKFLHVATECASALAAAHRQRIVHLDIKPENIMLTASGRVKVCDFGMALQLAGVGDSGDVNGTRRWAFGGTPAYMAPEVLESNRFDERADVFSLGVLFYEMLSGRHPFRSNDVATTTNRIMTEAVPPLRSVRRKLPPRLSRLVDRMLAKNPTDRVSSVEEVLNELRFVHQQQTLLKDAWKTTRETATHVFANRLGRTAVVLAAVIGIASMLYLKPLSTALPLPDKKIVVVLPFQIVGDNEEERSYAAGFSAQLTGKLMALTTIPGLQVQPASEVRAQKIESAEMARAEFGATIVVEGAFQFEGDQLRVSYKLKDATTLQELRQSSRAAPFADLSTLHDAATRDIVRMLELQLTPTAEQTLSVFGTSNPRAIFLYTLGLGYMSRYDDPDNVDKAIDRLTQAGDVDPQYAAAFAELGRAYAQKLSRLQEPALYDLGRIACERAFTLDALLPEASICRGLFNESKGDYELAKENYEHALKLSATNDAALRGLGRSLEELQRYDEAEEEYLKAISFRPHYWATQSWIAVFYNTRRHDYQKAIDHFNQALALAPDSAQIYYSLSLAYLNDGQYDKAVAAAEKSAALRPDLEPSHGNLGLIYLRARLYPKAIAPFEKAVSISKNYRSLGNLARIYWLNGRTEEARRNYELAIEDGKKLLEHNLRNHGVRLLLGRYYAMLGERIAAVGHLQLALVENRNDPHYLTIAATAYVRLGDRATALSLMEQAAKFGYTAIQFRGEPELDALKDEPQYVRLMTPKIQK